MAPKIMWIRDNQPDVYKKTKRFLLPGNYLLNYLTGEAYTDHSNASCSMLYDVRKGEWSEKLCGLLEIPTELLPAIRDSTHVAGSIDPEFAKSCGLSRDVKVVVGGGDEEVGAVGSGVIDHKALLDLTGTSEPMCLSLDEPILDPTRLLECHAHGYNGKWLLENTGGLSGGIYRWFKDQFGLAEAQQAEKLGIEPYEVLDRETSAIPPGCEGLLFLPFFSGAILPEWNPDARGVFIGLALGHTRQHFARSIMEGCAYVLKDAVEHLSKIGLSPSRVVLAGGGARALVWRQIKTDIINRHTVRCRGEVTALGAAILAAVGGRLHRNVGAAVWKIVSVGDELSPAPEAAAVYEKLYGMYRESYVSLKHVFTGISSFQEH
jgi:xylulokinase